METLDYKKLEDFNPNLIVCKFTKKYERFDFKADLMWFYNDARVTTMSEMYPVDDFEPRSVDSAETDGFR